MGSLIILFIALCPALLFAEFHLHRRKDKKAVMVAVGRRTLKSFWEALLPVELQPSSTWTSTILHYLSKEHIFGSYGATDTATATVFLRWGRFLCRSIILCCANTIIAIIFYGDDGSCSKFVTMHDCQQFRSYSLTARRHICDWQPQEKSCFYSSGGMADPSPLFVVLVCVLVAASPLLLLTNELLKHISRMASHCIHHNQPFPMDRVHQPNMDEFYHPEPVPLKLLFLRAAGFSLAVQNMDRVSARVESEYLGSRMRSLQEFDDVSSFAESMGFEDFDLFSDTANSTLESVVNKSRSKATKVALTISQITLQESQERYLMIVFVLAYLTKPSRRVAERYLLSAAEFSTANPMYRGVGCSILLMILLVAMLILLATLVPDRVGNDSFLLWLRVGAVCIALDVIVFQPLGVLLQRVVLVSYFKAELNTLIKLLQERSKLMLMRSSGVIRNYQWYLFFLILSC